MTRATGVIHAANPDKSKRLMRVLGCLADGSWRSTREIVHAAEVMAVSACVSELRQSGHRIDCECRGRGRFFYRLTPRAMPTEQMSLGVAA